MGSTRSSNPISELTRLLSSGCRATMHCTMYLGRHQGPALVLDCPLPLSGLHQLEQPSSSLAGGPHPWLPASPERPQPLHTQRYLSTGTLSCLWSHLAVASCLPHLSSIHTKRSHNLHSGSFELSSEMQLAICAMREAQASAHARWFDNLQAMRGFVWSSDCS